MNSGHLALCVSRILSTFHPLIRGSLLRHPSGTYSHSGNSLRPNSCKWPLPFNKYRPPSMIIGGRQRFATSLKVMDYLPAKNDALRDSTNFWLLAADASDAPLYP